MPVGNLLTLLDDITVILDDVWIMTRLSAKKTAGVLGDDLALNAQQAVGLHPDRELPVIAAVAKGSAKNKLILVPAAVLLRWAAPWLIKPLLMAGGLFLCYEGVEKLLHKVQHRGDQALESALPESERISGAVRTDLVLSAEILAITLGVVAQQPFWNVLFVLVAISLAMTVGVYGFVALIIKLDDLGLALQSRPTVWKQKLGMLILAAAPRLLAVISWLGTLAIFAVGGSIVAQGVPSVYRQLEQMSAPLALLAEGVIGLLMGALVMLVVKVYRRFFPATAKATEQGSH